MGTNEVKACIKHYERASTKDEVETTGPDHRRFEFVPFPPAAPLKLGPLEAGSPSAVRIYVRSHYREACSSEQSLSQVPGDRGKQGWLRNPYASQLHPLVPSYSSTGMRLSGRAGFDSQERRREK